MDFYNRLEGLLKEKGVSRKTMCSLIGVPYETLNSMIKRQSQSIAVDILQKTADFFNTTTDYLTGFSENRYPIKEISGNGMADYAATDLANKLKPLYDEAKRIESEYRPWAEPGTIIHTYVLNCITWIVQDIERCLNEDIREDYWEYDGNKWYFRPDKCSAVLNTRFYEAAKENWANQKEEQAELDQSDIDQTDD